MDIQINQAIAAVHAGREVRWQAQSGGFLDEWKAAWEPQLLAAVQRLGQSTCTDSLFVLALPQKHVGICRIADLDADPPTIRGVQLLLLTEAQYRDAAGDPFALADACPPSWHTRGSLPACTFALPLPRRTVAHVCEVLKSPDSPALFGAAQALVDGGRVVWVRPQSDLNLLRNLWMLLPTSTRWDLRPACWAASDTGSFHTLLVPRVEKGDFDHRFLSEEQAANYPEGRYELGVQAAAESGDQAELDRLFARRSRAETWRLGLWVAGGLIVLTLAVGALRWLTGK